jgi:type I restriction enzyme S subunit
MPPFSHILVAILILYPNELNDLNSKQLELIALIRQSILEEAVEGKLTAEWRREHHELIGGDNHALKVLEKIRAEKEQLLREGKLRKEQSLAPINDVEKPFELPEGWVWCRLGDIGITQTGTTPSTNDKANFGDNIPFVKPADISDKEINYYNEGLSEKGISVGRLIPNNSILMVCIGGSIGKAYFTDRDVSCNQQINAITPLANIKAEFLLQFLQSSYFQTEVWNKAMKSSTPIINKGKWENILVPLPPQCEQQVMLDRINKIVVYINELEKQVPKREEQSEMLTQSVLREAFATS